MGELLGGPMNFGVGPGLMYAQRGFQDIGSESEDKKHDFAFGPAFRLNYHVLSFMYVNIDAIYGLRSIFRHLTLNFQDVVVVSVGFRI